MTLATPRINEFAEKFYLRFLRQDKLSADVCSDMYDQFIRQMKKYQQAPGSGPGGRQVHTAL